MDVLEEQHERLHVGQLLHQLARSPGDLLRAPLALQRLEQAGSESEQIGDRVVLAAGTELVEGLLERVVV